MAGALADLDVDVEAVFQTGVDVGRELKTAACPGLHIVRRQHVVGN